MLLVDEADEMHMLEYKKNYVTFRPQLSQLDLKFNQVFQAITSDFTIPPNGSSIGMTTTNNQMGANNQMGTLLAVSSRQYVTICLLKPHFEVLMVYDKDKHGRNVPKQGYAHISFRANPFGLLIVWDKFAHLLDIEIQAISPVVIQRISSHGMQLLPESTLLAGLLSDTLVYHVSQSGIKIYPTAGFSS